MTSLKMIVLATGICWSTAVVSAQESEEVQEEPTSTKVIEVETADVEPDGEESEESYTTRIWESFQKWVDEAKDKGEEVSSETIEWTKQDFESIGDWQYRIEEFESDIAAEALQGRLNEIGSDRWELMWVQPAGKNVRYTFKRPTRSYIKNIPLSQLLKMMVPLGAGGDSPPPAE